MPKNRIDPELRQMIAEIRKMNLENNRLFKELQAMRRELQEREAKEAEEIAYMIKDEELGCIDLDMSSVNMDPLEEDFVQRMKETNQ